jgi:ATP-dependent Clp protease adaptor protein ClpS
MSTSIKQTTDIKLKISLPKNYKIMLLNNDHTYPEAVVEVLKDIFNKNRVEAQAIMTKAHLEGKSLVVIPVTKDMAEAKIEQAKDYCKLKEKTIGVGNWTQLKFASEEE